MSVAGVEHTTQGGLRVQKPKLGSFPCTPARLHLDSTLAATLPVDNSFQSHLQTTAVLCLPLCSLWVPGTRCLQAFPTAVASFCSLHSQQNSDDPSVMTDLDSQLEIGLRKSLGDG